MKLLSFKIEGRETFGAVAGDKVIDLGRKYAGRFTDLVDVLKTGALSEVEAGIAGAEGDYALADIEFLPVIPNPPKIICIGVNYETHRTEIGRDPSAKPMVFARFPASQVGHNEPMLAPPESPRFDYEGEIAVIIGKAGRRIAEKDCWEYIAGYAPYNDGSIRDWQRHTPQWVPGKNWYKTGAFGPWMTTRGEIADNQDLHLKTRLNGMEVQSAKSSDMIFQIPYLIEYCSTFIPLEPGDVIVTGTPGGVGVRRDPPLFMKDGDIVEVEITEIGVLSNPIKAEVV